ncbi:MAG TPA: HNH endonuclease signature motif containing protein, partial [Gammaproteobacteria bacterium]|nr:HNH endonuclease signature motif containing protein [Gammaproteobacteria bacterium]
GVGRADLPIETVKRLACDASLIVVTEDERGAPLNVGRKQRNVPTAIRRALWSRDRGCTFPGCQNTRFVDAHHIRHWAEGGETSVENTTLLCTHHHTLLHEGRYRLRRDQDGELYFQRADGRVIPRCGYRADDAYPLDDAHEHSADMENDPENPSAEGWLAAVVIRRKPSAEVREERGVYRVDRGRMHAA